MTPSPLSIENLRFDFPLQMIEESEMTPILDQQIRELLCQIFPDDAPQFLSSRYWHGSAPQFTILVHHQQQLIGHLGVVLRTIEVGHTLMTVAGIQSLGILPVGKGHGLGQHLINLGMNKAWQIGIEFGMLFCIPSLAPYYQQRGWQKCSVLTTHRWADGREEELPNKNITLVHSRIGQGFPPGPIH